MAVLRAHCISLILGTLLPLLPLPAQRTASGGTRVPTSFAPCTRCQITLTPVVTLGGDDPAHTFLQNAYTVRDRRGYYYVAHVNTHSEIHVFDARGKFVRTIGRKGSGPGEFRSIYHMTVGPGDSLFVTDLERPVQVFDTSGRYVREVPLPFMVHMLKVLGDGRFIVQGMLATPDAIGYPVHILDARGRAVRSFGSSQPTILPNDMPSTRRRVSLAPDGTILLGHLNRYVIERWDTAGRQLALISRDVKWFAPWSGDPHPDYDYERPKPSQGDPMESEGVLWTVVARPAPGWRQTRTQPRREGDGSKPLPSGEKEKYLDRLIEALDARTGAVLASLPMPNGSSTFLGNGYVAHRATDPDGLIAIEVFRVGLSPSR